MGLLCVGLAGGDWVCCGFIFVCDFGGWVVVMVVVSVCGGGQKQWMWAVTMDLWVAEKMR